MFQHKTRLCMPSCRARIVLPRREKTLRRLKQKRRPETTSYRNAPINRLIQNARRSGFRPSGKISRGLWIGSSNISNLTPSTLSRTTTSTGRKTPRPRPPMRQQAMEQTVTTRLLTKRVLARVTPMPAPTATQTATMTRERTEVKTSIRPTARETTTSRQVKTRRALAMPSTLRRGR